MTKRKLEKKLKKIDKRISKKQNLKDGLDKVIESIDHEIFEIIMDMEVLKVERERVEVNLMCVK